VQGNETKRDDRRGVGPIRSTEEVGTAGRSDPTEGRDRRSEEPLGGKTHETSGSINVSTKLERIAKLARQLRGRSLTNLAHHIDIDLVKEAHRRTRKSGALGVDGQSAANYAADLDANLQRLLDRAKSGKYVAPPVKRAWIPKANGERRGIGIPTFEDKVLQRAVAMVLEAVYEQDFMDCSHGFRPTRSAHTALHALHEGVMGMWGGWLIEVDIRRFFDTLDHAKLRQIVEQRIQDGVILRLIGKWLHAGVMEDDRVSYPERGTPQGGVISPLLANIYLHTVLDQWIETAVKPQARGNIVLVRYADDFVILCRSEQDARELFAALPKRFEAFGLQLHPDKTRLIEFRQPPRRGPKPKVSFDFLSFTHMWVKSRKNYWVLAKQTSKKRFARAVQAADEWCRANRHLPIREQHARLSKKLLGHLAYFAITGNVARVRAFREALRRTWRKWLNRRSYKAKLFTARFARVEQRYPLPPARIVHAYSTPVAKPSP
jgi:RNA-directed DNA polymerase